MVICVAKGCGIQFVKTRLNQRFHSVQCRERSRWSKRRDACLKGEALELYCYNPKMEQVQGDDFIVCRECGAKLQTLHGHLRHVHTMTSQDYRKNWTDAPFATESKLASQREHARNRRAADDDDPETQEARREKARQYQREYRATNVEELKNTRKNKRAANRDEVNRKKRQWCAANRDEINRRQRAQHAANRDERNAQQRTARAADPERFKKYAQKSYARHQKERTEYARQRRAAAWRPADWDTKPIEWRIIGTELLSQEYISNEDLGARLDSSRLLTCPYGDNWKSALSSTKATKRETATNLIGEIRKWVKRPGRSAANKSLSIPPSVLS